MSDTLSSLVRSQILAEYPQVVDHELRERFISGRINLMDSAELLERISAAQEQLTRELSVRLGL